MQALYGLLEIAVDPEAAALLERLVRNGIDIDVDQAVPGELQLPDDRREVDEDVQGASDVHPVSGHEVSLGAHRAPHHLPAFEHCYAQTGSRQVRGGGQRVVTSAHDEHIE